MWPFNANERQTDRENQLLSEDIGLLCSIMCFVPWSSFIAIPNPEDRDGSECGDGISLDDDNDNLMIPNWRRSGETNIGGQLSADGSEVEGGWSVFGARMRKHSIDGSEHSSAFSNMSANISVHSNSSIVVGSRRNNQAPTSASKSNSSRQDSPTSVHEVN